MWEVVFEAFLDTLKAMPVLYLVYLIVGYFAHKNKQRQIAKNSRRFGPLIGGGFGIVPQCGFASVMADLFARRSITIGTLFAVFIATSDEAFAILILYPEHYLSLLALLGIKFVFAVGIGYLIDLIFRKKRKEIMPYSGHDICDCAENHKHENHEHCEHHHDEIHNHSEFVENAGENVENNSKFVENAGENVEENRKMSKNLQTELEKEREKYAELEECRECHCCATNIFYDALIHTLKISALLFVVGAIMGLIFEAIGEENIKAFFGVSEILSIFIAGLVGLFPTCAVSVILVSFFVSGIITFPALVAGLCAGAGLGLVILFAKNKNLGQNILITFALYVIAVIIGLLTYLVLFFIPPH